MKERPILFSAPMIRAILDGRKSQTRRIVKLPDAPNHLGAWEPIALGGPGVRDRQGRECPAQAAISHTRTGKTIACPYGAPGDRLWVRETWQPIWADGVDSPPGYDEPEKWAISYPATDGIREYAHPDRGLTTACKPGIHMPRWASRITLEVTGVRVERLHEITEEDARAEGVEPLWLTRKIYPSKYAAEARTQSYREGFAVLWKEINGADSWQANPYVWVVEFKRLEAMERAA